MAENVLEMQLTIHASVRTILEPSVALSVAAVVGQTCSTSTRKVLFIGIVVLLICVLAALMLAFEEYLTVGEFFALRDIMHHEAGEITLLAFGSGVFLAATGFALYHQSQTADATQYPITIPVTYPHHLSLDRTAMAGAEKTPRS